MLELKHSTHQYLYQFSNIAKSWFKIICISVSFIFVSSRQIWIRLQGKKTLEMFPFIHFMVSDGLRSRILIDLSGQISTVWLWEVWREKMCAECVQIVIRFFKTSPYKSYDKASKIKSWILIIHIDIQNRFHSKYL